MSKFIDENIKYQLEQNVVDPNRIVIPLEEWMGASAVIDKPVGIIRCILFEGKKLKNVELTGMSDPYVKVLLGDKVVGKTKVIDNTYCILFCYLIFLGWLHIGTRRITLLSINQL